MPVTRRHRSIYVLFLIGILVPAVFPWFRRLFWLFQGNYYRTYSLFCVLGIITLSMMAFSRYLEDRFLRLWPLAVTAMTLVGILYVPFKPLQTLINPGLRYTVTTLLLLYGLLLIAGQLLTRQKLAGWLILGLSAIELIQFDRITVSNRLTFARDEVRGPVDIQDETVRALMDIMTTEKEQFFRLRKLHPSGSTLMFTVNDAMLYGYYGTSSYRSFNNVNYTNFLTAVNAVPPNSETATRWSPGLLNSSALSLFACEKYALVDNPSLLHGEAQYDFVKRYEKGYLFRNSQFLPFGLTFDRYITEDAFLSLPAEDKPALFLQAVVLPNKSGREKEGLTEIRLSDLQLDSETFALGDAVAARRKTALELTSFSQTRFEGRVVLDRESILVLQTPFDRGWRAFQDGQPMPVLKVDAGLLGVRLGAGQHKVELRYRNPFLGAASIISLVSFLILGTSLRRWPRLALPA